MNAPLPVPLVDVSPKSITLRWEEISLIEHTGRDPAIYYELQWLSYETGLWEILTTP
jgi:hypothetical protein